MQIVATKVVIYGLNSETTEKVLSFPSYIKIECNPNVAIADIGM
jgi:hypothetical protein